MAKKDNLATRQHQLALDEKPERSLPPTYASYDWTGEGLSERSGDNAVVYCYWDQPFGCKIQRQHRDPEDFLPDWPVIDALDYGRSCEARSVLSHRPRTLGTGIEAGPDADNALKNYLATLPRLLLRLAAPFGDRQWLLLDLFRRSPGLWQKLYQQTALGRLGVFSLSLDLFVAAGRLRTQQREEFAGFLVEAAREDVLRRYLGGIPDPSVLAMIEQIPPKDGLLDHRILTSVLKPSAGPVETKDLVRLRDGTVEELLQATHWRDLLDIEALLQHGLSFVRITQTIQTVLKNLTETERPAALKALGEIRVPQSLQWWSAHWTSLALRSRSFPAAPIAAGSLLLPIETAAALELESKRMRNGVGRYLADVLAGDLYFYHWDGDPAATLCLAATDSGDWILLEALGEDGVPIHKEALAEIIPAVQAG